MTFTVLGSCLLGVALLVVILVRARAGSHDEAAARLAILMGIKRVLGESEASLKRRAVSLSRWPHTRLAPEVAWWASLLARVWVPRSSPPLA